MKRFGLLLVAVALFAAAAPQAVQAQGPSIDITAYGTIDTAKQAEYRAALERALGYFRQEFGELDTPVIRLLLFENDDYAAAGMMKIFNMSEATARTAAQTFSAFTAGKINGILVNVSKPRDIPFQMAHELMHLYQYQWTGGARYHNWIGEGMADFYGAASLGAVDRLRQARIPYVRNKWGELSAMSLFGLDWTAFNQRVGGVTAYSFTFLAYEFLEQRTSRPAVLAYFRLLRTGYTPDNAFHAAFEMEPAAFEAMLKAYLRTLIAM